MRDRRILRCPIQIILNRWWGTDRADCCWRLLLYHGLWLLENKIHLRGQPINNIVLIGSSWKQNYTLSTVWFGWSDQVPWEVYPGSPLWPGWAIIFRQVEDKSVICITFCCCFVIIINEGVVGGVKRKREERKKDFCGLITDWGFFSPPHPTLASWTASADDTLHHIVCYERCRQKYVSLKKTERDGEDLHRLLFLLENLPYLSRKLHTFDCCPGMVHK